MRKKLFGCLGINRWVMVWMMVFCFGSGIRIYANNVSITEAVKVVGVVSGVATIEVDLHWENSWRDNYNWDGVWIFLKHKRGNGDWKPVYFQDVEQMTDNDYRVMNAKTGGSIPGVFVYPGKKGENAEVSTKLTLKWECGGEYSRQDFEDGKVFLYPQAIEMVYVPSGSFYAGDGKSTLCFSDGEGNPVLVEDEGPLTLYQRTEEGAVGGKMFAGAQYPKGYQGFYIMKYEVSQGQYVAFLNKLTRSQQEELLGVSFLSGLAEGSYVFGSAAGPADRNGIVLKSAKEDRPYVFAHNLNGNDVFGEEGDGQSIACNYLSVKDLLAYAAWAGLRPMSELEYERACRPFPVENPLPGEYAWNSTSGVAAVSSVSRPGTKEEAANGNTNVNVANHLSAPGPVRCGIFARPVVSQEQAGSTYWGVMEMSGNVGEMVANLKNAAFDREVNGKGVFATSLWSGEAVHYGVRGGNFAEAESLLRISDRSQAMGKIMSVTERSRTYGFRLVYAPSEIPGDLLPGSIALQEEICPGETVSVVNQESAKMEGATVSLSYSWSVKIGGQAWITLSGETGSTLTYNSFLADSTYQFKRKVRCSFGEAEALTTVRTILAPPRVITQPSNNDAYCGLSVSVEAKGELLTYQWQKDKIDIPGATFSVYAKEKTTHPDSGAYRCKITGLCGEVYSEEADIRVEALKTGTLKDDRDGEEYKIRRMPDGKVWMVEDLRFGTCSGIAFLNYSNGSVKDQIASGYYGVCMKSPETGAGNLYNWQGAMNAEDAAYGKNFYSWGNWQGICPEGWHLPAQRDFYELYAALCQELERFYPGTGVFEVVLGGEAIDGSVQNGGYSGGFWTNQQYSGPYNDFTGAYLMTINNSYMSYYSDGFKSVGHAVRCIKD